MVLIELESNAILVAGMQNCTSGEMVKAYQILIDRLKESTILSTLHILDNECPGEYKEAIKDNKMKYQLVPSNDHRRNVAEKVIQVFKYHFVLVLCRTVAGFPMSLWCQLFGQAEHQLNMLYSRQGWTSRNQATRYCMVDMTITPTPSPL